MSEQETACFETGRYSTVPFFTVPEKHSIYVRFFQQVDYSFRDVGYVQVVRIGIMGVPQVRIERRISDGCVRVQVFIACAPVH